MGKIIEFKNEHDLDIGTILWAVGENDVRKYKPCPACNNERTIKVHDDGGSEYDMPCPRCHYKQTGGDESKDFKHYKAVAYRIYGFEISDKHSVTPVQKIMLSQCYGETDSHKVQNTDITNSETLTAIGYWKVSQPTQFYISEDEAKTEAKRLNAEQAVAIKEFLGGNDNG